MLPRLLIVLSLAPPVFPAAAGAVAPPPRREASSDLDPFVGVVKEVGFGDKGATILVERGVTAGMGRVRFRLDKGVPVALSDGRRARLRDLKVGQKVTVRTTSDICDSCPPQMDADSVVIDVGSDDRQLIPVAAAA